MSKAEDLAKKYCEGSSFEDACMERPAYIAGYHQAEKDLELTWENINDIKLLIDQVECDYEEIDKKLYTKDFYQEVLKRFKEKKENEL